MYAGDVRPSRESLEWVVSKVSVEPNETEHPFKLSFVKMKIDSLGAVKAAFRATNQSGATMKGNLCVKLNDSDGMELGAMSPETFQAKSKRSTTVTGWADLIDEAKNLRTLQAYIIKEVLCAEGPSEALSNVLKVVGKPGKRFKVAKP